MDKLLSSMLGMLTWTFTEAPIRAASLIGRLSRSSQFEAVVGAEIGRSVALLRALTVLFSNTNPDVASCSMRCCWELLRGSSQGSVSLFMSTLLEERNSQLLKMVVNACVQLLNASNTQLSVQSTLVLNQILAVRDSPQLLAGLTLLKSISESCCNIIASQSVDISFQQLPIQLQVGCLRLILRASSDVDCLSSVRRSDCFDELVSQLQQASLASNKQVSSFATKVVNLLRNENQTPVSSAAASAPGHVEASSTVNHTGSGLHPQETVAPSSIESVFAHGKALRSAIVGQSPSVFLNAAATQAMADEFRATSILLVQEQARVEELNSKVLLLELELQQKELQNQSLLDESRAVSETLSNADAAIRQLQEDIQKLQEDIHIRDARLLSAVDTHQSELNKDHEIQTLRAELQSQRQHCDAFSQEVTRLLHERQELIKSAGEMQQMKSELGSSLASSASLQRQLLEREHLLSTLQQQLSDAHVKDAALASANAAIANLESIVRQKVSDLEAETAAHAKTASNLESVTAAHAKLQNDLQTREQLLILAHSQAATALETIAAVEAAAGRTQGNDFANLLSAANQENADLRSRISELENELVRQSRDSATKVDGLAMQAAKENASLVQQIVELEKRLQQMSQDMQALSESRAADLAQYEHKLKLAEASASSNSDFSAEKSAADSRFQELLKLSELAVEDLKSRLRAADTAILEASERESLLLAQKSELDADILSLRSLVDELRCGSQSQWSDYNEKSAMELALEEESKNLRAQLESQLGDFQGIMDAKDHIIEQLTEQVKKQQHQLEDAQAVNQVNSNTIVSQSSIIGKLQSQVDQSSNSNAAVSSAPFPQLPPFFTSTFVWLR
jgi:DNA repair exonuclease SbcCD ATPase subunit